MGVRDAVLTLEDGTIIRNLAAYSVSEDAASVNIADQSGGANQSSISVSTNVDGKMLHRLKATLSDGTNGLTTGTISNPSTSTPNLSLPLNSALDNLTATRTALPYSGTLAGYFQYLLGLVGVSDAAVDASFEQVNVVFAGWNGDVRTNMWDLCSAYHAEVALVGAQVTVRPVRQRTITSIRDSAYDWALSDQNIAQSIEGYWYETEPYSDSTLVYPPGGWNASVQVLTVSAGAVQEYDLDLTNFDTDTGEGPGFSVADIAQPVCVASVGPNDNSASVYTVCGDDGLPVPPDEWAALGGSLVVSINPDGQSLHVVITGMSGIGDANGSMIQTYSIAMSSGSSTDYSTLRIVGGGVAYKKHLVTALTGLSADVAPTQVGVTVDSCYITNPAQLWSVLTWPLADAQGPSHSISVTSRAINRASDTGSVTQITIAQFDAHYAGYTIAQIDADNAGLTLDQVEAKEATWVSGDFANQAFGNIAGARIFRDGMWYRITTATITPSSTQYTAVADATVADFDSFYEGYTIAQLDALNANRTLIQQAVRPLVR